MRFLFGEAYPMPTRFYYEQFFKVLDISVQVYVCGQPTQQGFEAILDKVTGSYPKEAPIVWINMRQVSRQ